MFLRGKRDRRQSSDGSARLEIDWSWIHGCAETQQEMSRGRKLTCGKQNGVPEVCILWRREILCEARYEGTNAKACTEYKFTDYYVCIVYVYLNSSCTMRNVQCAIRQIKSTLSTTPCWLHNIHMQWETHPPPPTITRNEALMNVISFCY